MALSMNNNNNNNSNIANINNDIIKLNIEAKIIGTEERNPTSFNKYTIYITEIKINGIIFKIFVRYSEMVELETKIY